MIGKGRIGILVPGAQPHSPLYMKGRRKLVPTHINPWNSAEK
jgi:hypothetical protein